MSGEATVIAPAQRIERPRSALPHVRIELSQGDDLVRLLQERAAAWASQGGRRATRATRSACRLRSTRVLPA
jgi:hypothetical protein